jgi:phospholipid-binding lipoprotein MlaA
MRKIGLFIFIGVIIGLAGTPVAAGQSGHENLFSRSNRATDNERFESWGVERPVNVYRVADSERYRREQSPVWARDLWAQNANDSAEDEWADEWEDDEGVADEIPDPLMGLNWIFFQFNDKFYLYLWEPLAKGYGKVVPEAARKGVRNFFSNLTTPIRLVNCMLQGKWSDAGNESARFLINTTAGVLGFGDPAFEDYGPPKDEDFGQTLGYWGLNDGFFLTLPFIGSSSLRDGIGFYVDGYLNPVSYIDGKPHRTTPTKIAIRAYEKFNATSFQIGEYERLKGMALDPYVAIRNIYFQNRQKKIAE